VYVFAVAFVGCLVPATSACLVPFHPPLPFLSAYPTVAQYQPPPAPSGHSHNLGPIIHPNFCGQPREELVRRGYRSRVQRGVVGHGNLGGRTMWYGSRLTKSTKY
jgi:hypothetical protein